jgi:hypothetical protein
MAVSFVAAGTLGATNGTSTTPGLPAGLATNDLLVLQVLARGTASTTPTPSGYTLAATVNITNGHRQSVFYKVCTNAGTEAAPSPTQTVSALIEARVTAWRGVDTTNPLDVAAVTAKKTAQSTFAAASITPASAGAMVLWCLSTPDDNTLNAHTQGTVAYSSDTTTGNDGAIALVYELQATAGASGTCSMTQSANGPDNWNTITLALRPAVAASANPSAALFDDATFMVEVALGSTPFAPNPAWTDITSYLLDPQMTITLGRESESAETNTGTLELTFDNHDRRFDPDYEDGPYYGMLDPMTPIRVRVRRDGSTRTKFHGFIQAWPQSYLRSFTSWVTLQAFDVQSILATTTLPDTLLALDILSDDPALYFPLNEEEGRATSDLSGNGWAASYTGIPTSIDSFLAGERDQKAISLNRAAISGVGSSVENLRTLEFWVRIDAVNVEGQALLVHTSATSNGFEVTIDNTTGLFGGLSFNTAIISASGGRAVGATAPFTQGQPYHVAVVLNSAATTFTLYLNGVAYEVADVSGSVYEGGTTTTAVTAFTFLGVDVQMAHLAAYSEELTATQIAEHYAAGVTGGYLQTVKERMQDLADFAGLTDAGLYDDSDLRSDTYLGQSSFSGSVIDAMQEAVRTEQGRMFVRGGALVVQGRMADIVDVTENVVSQATFGDAADFSELMFTDITPVPASTEQIRNTEFVSVDGATVAVYDRSSRLRFGERPESISTALADTTAGSNLGLSRLRRFGAPTSRIDALVIEARAQPDDLLPFVLDVEPGWRITVHQRPQYLGDPIVKVLTAEGMRHVLTHCGWVTTLYLVPAQEIYSDAPWFVFGDATYGTFGATNLLPY